MARKYVLPDFLHMLVTQEQYVRWLRRKAAAHVRRDRKRGNLTATGVEYRIAIHRAVMDSGGRDFYTGEKLDWTLISTYENEISRAQGRRYKSGFALLPTVDHVGDGLGPAEFQICAWRTNDAKHDLNLSEFVALCDRVLTHHRREAQP